MARKRRLIVEREDAGNYLLISLVSFAATVIVVRLFLELTGYPQLGNSTLHIAHLLYGGVLLFAAVLIALIWDNPGFMVVAASLSGVGIGLFIMRSANSSPRTMIIFILPPRRLSMVSS